MTNTRSSPRKIIPRTPSIPSHYKITHWGYDVDFRFTMDEEGNILVDADQETGFTYDSYGMIYIDDLVDYTGVTNYGVSYFDAETNIFNFALAYYDAKYNDLVYGMETFILNAGSEVNLRPTLRK